MVRRLGLAGFKTRVLSMLGGAMSRILTWRWVFGLNLVESADSVGGNKNGASSREDFFDDFFDFWGFELMVLDGFSWLFWS